MKIYRADNGICSGCQFRVMCTKSSSRAIERWESEEIIEKLRSKLKTPEALRIIGKRKELTEHPFGTIKRAFNLELLRERSIRVTCS
jgi:hypothetical protein